MFTSITRFTAILILLFSTFCAWGQKFYAHSIRHTQTGIGKTFLMDLQACDSTEIDQCPASNDTGSLAYQKTYTDIAFDRYENVWYLSAQGGLYKRDVKDPNSCVYAGNFTPKGFINSLVADSGAVIYAAGGYGDTCYLYKYVDTGAAKGFSTLGKLNGYAPAGDLFFYKHRLFLAASSSVHGSCIVEITLPDPQYSCYYMSLGKINAWGAFTIVGDPDTRVFVAGPNTSTSSLPTSSSVVEIDIPNRKILDTVCTYPFPIGGAATYYGLTADTTTCVTDTPTTIHNTIATTGNYLILLNPVSGIIRLQTNISPSEINTLTLYDQYGRKVTTFTVQDFPNNLDITGIPYGIYILHTTTKDGRQWVEKMVKTGD